MTANSEAPLDMSEGYRDGLRDAEDDFPDRLANRSASYRHGWLNGRDDRKRSPRTGAEDLRQQAEAAIEKDAMP